MKQHPLYVHIKKDWLEDQYIAKEKSANQIAKDKGVNVKLILRRLKKFDILKRSMSEQKRLDNIRIGKWVGDKNPMTNSEIKKKALANRRSYKGENNPNYGKKHTKPTRDKIRQKAIGRVMLEKTKQKIRDKISKEKHYNWQGGISFEPYSLDWTKTLKTSIRQRDKFTCQVCGENGFIVHHIDYDKKNCDPKNLITLCKKCHSKTNGNRAYWTKYFKDIS